LDATVVTSPLTAVILIASAVCGVLLLMVSLLEVECKNMEVFQALLGTAVCGENKYVVGCHVPSVTLLIIGLVV